MTSKLQKKVTLNDQRHDVVFALDTSVSPHILSVYCKELQTSSQYCGSFRLSDLQPHYQAIFQKIQNLYHYISERTEQVQIQSCDRIKIQLNFLKQSKEITLNLSKMMMCSAQENKKQIQKLKVLQIQNEMLKNRLGVEGGGSGLNKFTIPCDFGTFNVVSYRVSNFCQVTPITHNHLLSLVKANKKTMLPKTGLCYFHILTSKFLQNSTSRVIELGVKSDFFQKSIITLKSNPNAYSYGPEQEKATEENLEQNDLLRLVFNMDARQLVIQKNFRVYKLMSWKNLKGTDLWPYIRIYMVSVKTDIFIEEQNIVWGLAETAMSVE